MQNSLSNASIIASIGSILTALGIFPFRIIILILETLNQYSKALNNPYIFQFGSRGGIILFISSLAFIILTGVSAVLDNSTFGFVVAVVVLYIVSIYAGLFDLKKL